MPRGQQTRAGPVPAPDPFPAPRPAGRIDKQLPANRSDRTAKIRTCHHLSADVQVPSVRVDLARLQAGAPGGWRVKRRRLASAPIPTARTGTARTRCLRPHGQAHRMDDESCGHTNSATAYATGVAGLDRRLRHCLSAGRRRPPGRLLRPQPRVTPLFVKRDRAPCSSRTASHGQGPQEGSAHEPFRVADGPP